ncbi:MAG: hypothetical protein IAI50_08570 [Candidatus Eremiobacteraeota bacterium]|nr:hypothetical protein [Candidatus Eremiobacteraeota bacterium]
MKFVRFPLSARLASFASVVLLTACNGYDGYDRYYNSGPEICSYNNATIALISPAPHTTTVPDNFSQVIIATNVSFPNTYDAVITGNVNGFQKQVAFGDFTAATLPAGATAPAFANPIYYASANLGVTFSSKSQISVALNNTRSGCVAGASIGTFTVL